MTKDTIYEEKIRSNRTEALFIALTILFLVLLIWRVNSTSLDGLAIAFLCFFGFFFFYSLNYRTLIISITPQSLKLRFGIFSWNVPFDNVDECGLDELPDLMRMGGAGIHFMFIRHRYRVSFNFLEYPRVVIALKKKQVFVRDISFSTRRPEDVLRHIRQAISLHDAV